MELVCDYGLQYDSILTWFIGYYYIVFYYTIHLLLANSCQYI